MELKLKNVVDKHEQRDKNSCIPSAVEIVLKTHGLVAFGYYGEQKKWGDKSKGSLGDYHRRTVHGLTFEQIARLDPFPDETEKRIWTEVNAGRFPIVSLFSGIDPKTQQRQCHMYAACEENGKLVGYSKGYSIPVTLRVDIVVELNRLPPGGGGDLLVYARDQRFFASLRMTVRTFLIRLYNRFISSPS